MAQWTRRSFLAASLCLGACTRLDRPPLGALYRPAQGSTDQPPLVVIPGAFGSTLHDRRTGHEVWPGSTLSLLASDYRDLEVTIDPDTCEPCADDIVAQDVFEARRVRVGPVGGTDIDR